MSNKDTMSLICKKCGKNIEIPSDLEEFACIFCGEKMTIQDFHTGEDVDNLIVRLAPFILENRSLLESFSQNGYSGAFNSYMLRCYDVLAQLNASVLSNPTRRNEILKSTAKLFIAELQAAWKADPRWKSRLKRDMMKEDDKLIMAIFTVPMIREQGLAISEDLAEAIHAEWMEAFPKSPFLIGSYEDINNGFRKKILGLCFITTAVCEFDGKPDNCRELTTLRAFRDGYLASQPDGPALIDEYYENAPVIVTLMDLTADREKCYTELRDEYILPCVEDAEAGRLEACKSRYISMMRALEKRYLPRA